MNGTSYFWNIGFKYGQICSNLGMEETGNQNGIRWSGMLCKLIPIWTAAMYSVSCHSIPLDYTHVILPFVWNIWPLCDLLIDALCISCCLQPALYPLLRLYLCHLWPASPFLLHLVCWQAVQALHWHYTICLGCALLVKEIDGKLSCGYAFRRACWQCDGMCLQVSGWSAADIWPVILACSTRFACLLQHLLSALTAEILYT